jgi:TetR/AcrR family transcriptional repressor of bet genes
MTGPRRSSDGPQAPAAPRASRARQRQRLIDACISALHLHGPSKTTVEKVVAIAHLSPGIVRFYFESKDAMLVASLEFLATEFEELVLVPVAALRERPVEALGRLVELYLGPEIASARKVSVWYSFWGEASSRQEYYDICGTRDSKFETLVRDLVAAVIDRERLGHLDADAIALGLIGVLEMLWQGFAFQTESTIDRVGARRRALAYLRSVFPTAFVPASEGPASTLPPAAYTTPAVFALELAVLYRDTWQFAGLASELADGGDYVVSDGPADRAIVVRDAEGELRAMRNVCRQRPHLLVSPPAGRLTDGIRCDLHGLHFGLSGVALGDSPGGPLDRLALAVVDGLLWVRSGAAGPPPSGGAMTPAHAASLAHGTHDELEIAADWKVVVENWLERPARAVEGGTELGGDPGATTSFVAPNHLLRSSDAGLRVLQVVPVAAGRCQLRIHDYGRPSAAPLPGSATPRARLAAERALAESVQRGLESPAYRPEISASAPPALEAFRRSIARLLPGGIRSPGDRP